jgi:hypothetical protein
MRTRQDDQVDQTCITQRQPIHLTEVARIVSRDGEYQYAGELRQVGTRELEMLNFLGIGLGV